MDVHLAWKPGNEPFARRRRTRRRGRSAAPQKTDDEEEDRDEVDDDEGAESGLGGWRPIGEAIFWGVIFLGLTLVAFSLGEGIGVKRPLADKGIEPEKTIEIEKSPEPPTKSLDSAFEEKIERAHRKVRAGLRQQTRFERAAEAGGKSHADHARQSHAAAS